MKLENEELKIGQTVFFPKESVNRVKYKPATVVELVELKSNGVVKLEIVLDIKSGKIKREWFPLSALRRSEPPKEVEVKK